MEKWWKLKGELESGDNDVCCIQGEIERGDNDVQVAFKFYVCNGSNLSPKGQLKDLKFKVQTTLTLLTTTFNIIHWNCDWNLIEEQNYF